MNRFVNGNVILPFSLCPPKKFTYVRGNWISTAGKGDLDCFFFFFFFVQKKRERNVSTNFR